MKRPEQTFQIRLVRDLALILTPKTWFCHIPNGGWRTKAEAGIFKAMGVRSGAPDLLFIHEGRAFFMELKVEGGTLSMSQVACRAELRAAGAHVATVHNMDEALDVLALWQIPTRIAQRSAA